MLLGQFSLFRFPLVSLPFVSVFILWCELLCHDSLHVLFCYVFHVSSVCHVCALSCAPHCPDSVFNPCVFLCPLLVCLRHFSPSSSFLTLPHSVIFPNLLASPFQVSGCCFVVLSIGCLRSWTSHHLSCLYLHPHNKKLCLQLGSIIISTRPALLAVTDKLNQLHSNRSALKSNPVCKQPCWEQNMNWNAANDWNSVILLKHVHQSMNQRKKWCTDRIGPAHRGKWVPSSHPAVTRLKTSTTLCEEKEEEAHETPRTVKKTKTLKLLLSLLPSFYHTLTSSDYSMLWHVWCCRNKLVRFLWN